MSFFVGCNTIIYYRSFAMLFKLLSLIFSKIMFLFGRISSEKAFEKPLTIEEEKECFSKLKQGDKTAEEKLIKHNMRLVAHVSKKYKNSMPQDELISAGSIGLLKAVKTFNYDKGSSFSTYATRCINNEILMLLRADKKFQNQVYLEDTVSTDKDGNEISLIEIIPENSENIFDKIHNQLAFEKVLGVIKKHLTDREQQVIFMRYGICGYHQYTQIEISEKLGISRSYISRIEKHALEVIKANIDKSIY